MHLHRLLPLASLGALSFATLGLTAGCGGGSNEKTLVILHTTDEHSHVLGFGPELDDYPAATTAGTRTIVGGIGRRSALIAQERAAAKAKGADSILVSAGDNSMGTLMQVGFGMTAPDFELMKTLGYDATTLGNHEFDYGPANLAAALQVASDNGGLTPTVSSNIHFSDSDAGDDALAALYDSTGEDTSKLVHNTWTITTANGLKVGFIGIVGVDAAQKAAGKTPVTFSIPSGGTESDATADVLKAIYADLTPAVSFLRDAKHVDVVVALSHSGVDTQDPTQGEDYQIAQNVPGIDVIVSGHTHVPVEEFTVVNLTSGKPVYIQQANCFGQHLGKITVKVQGGQVTLDPAGTSLSVIDDTTVSDAALNPKIDSAISTIEAGLFLPTTLGIITGNTVTDDTSKIGDLYFYPIGKTNFTVIGKALQKDTPLMDLWADAELLATEAVAGPTDLSIVAQGALRADLNQGKSGVVSFADVFRAVPLGASPNKTIGFPLGKTYLLAAEVKAAFEVAAGYAYTTTDAADYYLAGGGVKVEYDTSRPQFDSKGSPTDPNNGRVTKITLATDHTNLSNFDKVIFDLSQGGWTNGVAFSDMFSVTANLYVIQFAYVAGVTLKDSTGTAIMPTDTIVHRADSTEIKDWEAVAQFIRNSPNMTVPASYMTASHMVCSGPLCK